MEECPGEIIALDGKTARGSLDRKNDKNPLHMVSAWACEQRLILGQKATDDQSNEITALPKLLKLLVTFNNTSAGRGLCSIGMVERECTQAGSTSIEQRYFISSIKPVAPLFAKAVRSHWGVENPLYWRLDVVLGDDACRIKKDNGAPILTRLRHLCMNLFEQKPSKMSLAKKFRKAAWSDHFRSQVTFP